MLLLVTGFLVLGLMRGQSLHTNFNPKTMVLLAVDPVRDGYTAEPLPPAVPGGAMGSSLSSRRAMPSSAASA